MKIRWLDIAVFIGVWTAWAVFLSALIAHVEKIPFVYLLYCNIILFGTAAVLSLPVIGSVGWLDSRALNPFFTIILVCIACFCYSAAWIWLTYLVFVSLFGPYFMNLFDPRSGWIFLNGIVMCGVIYGISYARLYSRKLHEAELKRAELHLLARENELRALRSQINPHYLFNSINSIYAMIETDPAGAKDMLVKLSDLLRSSLAEMDREFVSFEKDLQFTRRYLDIEKIRFGDRLRLEMFVDEDVLSEQVPSLFLQPVVENAVKHGVASSKEPVTITITAGRKGSHLEVSVRDTGRGLKDTAIEDIKNQGHGLRNLAERLSRIYGNKHRLHFSGGPESGFQVSLELPVTESRGTS